MMESTDWCDYRENVCPILCVAKAVFFALVAVFVLYFPLGDPNVICNSANRSHNQKLATSYVCDIYIMTVKMCNKTKEVAELLLYKTKDILYEAKLKFYTLLGRFDRGDLYQSVCCSDSMDKTEENDHKHLGCKCSRKCCRNKIPI